MLVRLLLIAILVWLLITFTSQILAWGADILTIVLDHVRVVIVP